MLFDDVNDYSTKVYSSIKPDSSLKSAIILMEELNIWDLPVVDDEKSKRLITFASCCEEIIGYLIFLFIDYIKS